MDKKGNSRQNSVQKSNAEFRKDVTSRNQRSGKKRGSYNSSGGNFSYNDGQNRKPTPQKYRNTWDKRPRQRGELATGSGGDLDDGEVGVEYGSAILAGSKKGNLNHLLNFTYEHEINPAGYGGHGYGNASRWYRGRQVRYKNTYSRGSKMCYNKEQFLQANCQFVVKEAGDYSVHLMDPDTLVNWDKVEQVRVIDTEPPSCPICLHYPIAAKMTRCGHIYCWSCILHYLALGEKTWRKCPICYEAVHSDDLKSVIIRHVKHHKVGDEITLTLMKKEKGSIYAVPANLWQKQPGKCHNVTENEEITRHMKLITATPDQVLAVTEQEKQQLMVQLVDAESSEEAFIKGAQDQLKSRELGLLGISEVEKEVQEAVQTAKSALPAPKPDVAVKTFTNGKKVKQYKSAFSDEEEELDTEQTGQEPDNMEQSREVQPNTESAAPAVNATITEEPLSDLSARDGKSSPSIPVNTVGSSDIPKDELLVGSPEGVTMPIELLPDIMPVEEAAQHLELPTQQRDKTLLRSGDNCFYFYQADDGQQIYLHSLNARCLVREYGSLEQCPQKITANIVEKESVFVTEELRKRLRYLSHLPLTCGFEVVELELKPPLVSKDTLKHFTDEIDKRRRLRQRKAREDKRIARYIEDQERKKHGIGGSTIVHSQFQQQQQQQQQHAHPPGDMHSDNRSDTSSPSLDTPVGSPQVAGLNVEASEFHPSTSPGDQTSTVSFAQMLKAGAKASVWPKAKSESSSKSPMSPTSGRPGSDESDNEDKIPVPKFQSSFGSAIEAAFENIHNKTDMTSPQSSPAAGSSSGKKKRKQLVLFSTNMARGGK